MRLSCSRVERGLGSRADVKLVKNMTHVDLHRCFADIELLRYRGIPETDSNKRKYFRFSPREGRGFHSTSLTPCCYAFRKLTIVGARQRLLDKRAKRS